MRGRSVVLSLMLACIGCDEKGPAEAVEPAKTTGASCDASKLSALSKALSATAEPARRTMATCGKASLDLRRPAFRQRSAK